MARKERNWHPDFIDYMKMIVSHPNYKGLEISKKADGSHAWVDTRKNSLNKQKMKAWAEEKAQTLGFKIQPGVYADVMREIHPTGFHICQICGSKMSIYYHYPSTNFVKSLVKKFDIEFGECDHIGDIWDVILESGIGEDVLISFMRSSFSLPNTVKNTKNDIIKACEFVCRKGRKKLLSPGAMSNYTAMKFLINALEYFYKQYRFKVRMVQTDNGREFTNRFDRCPKETLFEKTLAKLEIPHKLIRPYTPRHNGKVERSHREDQKRFYDSHEFYSLDDLNKQLCKHLRYTNNRPMRPLNYLSPIEYLNQFYRQRGKIMRMGIVKGEEFAP